VAGLVKQRQDTAPSSSGTGAGAPRRAGQIRLDHGNASEPSEQACEDTLAALVEQGQKSVAWGDLGRLLDGR